MKEEMTTTTESRLSRRAVLRSLAAAAVMNGCKSTAEPDSTPNADKGESKDALLENSGKSKAALALWLLFTTRDGYFDIDYKAGGSTITPANGILNALSTDLQSLAKDPGAAIGALITALQTNVLSGISVQDPSGGPSIAVPYSQALKAVRELFQKFGHADLKGMDKTDAPYTGGQCCPRAVGNILSLTTLIPKTKDSMINPCHYPLEVLSK
jgi:hypothetical protein